jgi:phage replication-related protein YjqB (UPF0714/DUF867 family)
MSTKKELTREEYLKQLLQRFTSAKTLEEKKQILYNLDDREARRMLIHTLTGKEFQTLLAEEMIAGLEYNNSINNY